MLLLKTLASTRQEALASQKALLPDITLIEGILVRKAMRKIRALFFHDAI